MKPVLCLLLLVLAGAASPAADCVPVAGVSVRASDLAAVVPAFGSLDPALPLAASPQPGVRRVVGPRELSAWARRAGLELDHAVSLCLERRTERLESARLESTLAQSLAAIFGPGPELSWQVISFRPLTVPPGDLSFTRSGLQKAGAGLDGGVHLWRGQLRYEEGRRSLPVVVTLRLSRQRKIAKAATDLDPHTRLEAGHVVESNVEVSPLDPVRYADPAVLAGRRLRRPVAAGQPFLERDLDPVYAIERGAQVVAEATVGGARIAVPAVAQTPAVPGQRVWLRNPDTKKTFSGRAVGAGRVEADSGPAPPARPRSQP